MKLKSTFSSLLGATMTLAAAFVVVTTAMASQDRAPGFKRHEQYSVAQNTIRVSVASDGTQANSNSSYYSPSPLSISADERYIAFASNASNLVDNDTNERSDIFIHDRETGETTRVSVASDGSQANGHSYEPSISADGRFVVFESFASNLVSGGIYGPWVFVHDRQTGETARISRVPTIPMVATESHFMEASISADGRYILYSHLGNNQVENDTNHLADIFVNDRQTNQITRVSLAYDGSQANGHSYAPSFSADGRIVAFASQASNLVAGDTNEIGDIFVHDRQTGETTRVSVASDGSQANHSPFFPLEIDSPAISANGRFVAFAFPVNNLVLGDTNEKQDIFVHDRQTGQTTRVSLASDGSQANGDSSTPSISADGRYVAFVSSASNLVTGDTNGMQDVFVHDRQTGETIRIPNSPTEFQPNNRSYYPLISGDGRTIAFASYASNLVSGDTNGFLDVFVYENLGKLAPTPAASNAPLAPTLSWQPISGAASYEYCYSSAPGPCTKWNSVGADTSITLSGLAPNYTYYWQVRANGVTEADGGTWWSFTTTATPACTFPPHTTPSTASFVDVPLDHWAWDWIERYKSAGLTTGCSWVPGGYCPGDNVTREQMAVFIMRAKNCGDYTPATVTSAVFSDVPADHWAAGFIRDFRDAKITSGCAWVPGGYCPGDTVNREQMAVFIIRARHGGTYSPPAVTEGVFSDVPANHWAATYIKQFYDEVITTGCSWVPGGYCPGDNVTREQMAVFIGRAFDLLP